MRRLILLSYLLNTNIVLKVFIILLIKYHILLYYEILSFLYHNFFWGKTVIEQTLCTKGNPPTDECRKNNVRQV